MAASERDDQACYDAALRFLAPRPRSEREIRQRLARHDFEGDRVDRVVARLRDSGLVDDAAFAAYWVESRDRHRPRGALALRSELAAKGLDRGVVDTALEDRTDDSEGAYVAGHARLRALARLDERAFRQRLGEHLRRRGFTWDSVSVAIDRLWRERAEGNAQ